MTFKSLHSLSPWVKYVVPCLPCLSVRCFSCNAVLSWKKCLGLELSDLFWPCMTKVLPKSADFLRLLLTCKAMLILKPSPLIYQRECYSCKFSEYVHLLCIPQSYSQYKNTSLEGKTQEILKSLLGREQRHTFLLPRTSLQSFTTE